MRRPSPFPAAPQPDMWLAAGASLALGCGIVLAAAATAADWPAAAAIGGVVLAGGLAALIAGGWNDGLVVAALAIPLPALLSTGDIRVATAAPVTAAIVAGWLLADRRALPVADLGDVRKATLWLFAAFAIAAVAGSSWLVSARELLNMGLLLAFFMLALNRVQEPGTADRLVGTFTLLGAVCGALAVLEMVGVLPGAFPRSGTPYQRAALGFGQPNGLGLFLAVTLPLTVHGVRTTRGAARSIAVLALLTCAAGLFATFSRGSWLAVLGGASALVFVRDTRLLGRVLIGALVLGVLLDVISGGMLQDTVERTLTDWALEQRAALMFAGVLMFVAHPLLGVGPGGFAVELERFGARIPQLWDYLPTPHNAYVQMAAETGVVGLAAYIVFLALCFRRLVLNANDAADTGAAGDELSLRRCLVWSFATACCVGLVEWPFAHGTGQAVLLLLAVGLARQ